MPIIFRIKKIVLYFYSSEHLPIHVHIKAPDRAAKIEVESGKIIYNKGFSKSDMKELQSFIIKNRNYIVEAWNEFFKSKA